MAETAVPRIVPSLEVGAQVDLSRVHFVGIGGMGMLPLARVCAERGFTVTGSDLRSSAGTEMLAACCGVTVHIGHAAAQLPADATAVVFTHAVAADNPEIEAAVERGIPVVHRSMALQAVMEGKTTVGVLGTHGKTSTAGMLAVGLTGIGQDPTYVVGGDLHGSAASGGRAGLGDILVAEVDESDRTHLGLSVDIAVITDIGHDHPENYAGVEDHVDAYAEFVGGMGSNGVLVLNADSPACRELAARLHTTGTGPRLVTFGRTPNATWRLTDVEWEGGGGTATLHGPGGRVLDLRLPLPGVHQLMNAAAVVAASDALNQDIDLLVKKLAGFGGVARRMSLRGEAAGVRVYDSYAHHPTEITADLAAAHALTGGRSRVLAVFQPAGQARLDAFGADFALALAGADEVVLTDSASGVREASLRELSVMVSSVDSGDAPVERDRAAAVTVAAAAARPGDVVMLIGTGDLVEYGQTLLNEVDDAHLAVA
ncbi:UDP-N-acetylmuramate--L-alanine ligase [Streptomyces sp. NPDC059787]|uniref:UDP-N-acetylmuramate--L-alanine ligase n=1 Tax=Streptomyces sp. NPDC059787 TaxID=3346947 RepID=UPI0036559CF4